MSPIIRMETEQVQQTARQLTQLNQQILEQVQMLQRQVESIPWQGPSRDEFVLLMEELVRRFASQTDQGNLLASRAEREAAEWLQADATFGGGAGGGAGWIPGVPSILPEGGVNPFQPGYTTQAIGEEGQLPGIGEGVTSPFSDNPELPYTLSPGENPEGTVNTMALGHENQEFPPIDPSKVPPAGPGVTSPSSDMPEQPWIDPSKVPPAGPGVTSPSSDMPESPRIEINSDSTLFRAGESADGSPLTSPTSDNPEMRASTMAMGEEGQQPPIEINPELLDGIGENITSPTSDNPEMRASTMAIGEEGQRPPPAGPEESNP